MKPTTLLLTVSCATLLVGCHRSYQDSQLAGSWQITTNRITQTFTFSPDHTFTVKTESSKNLTVFGDWVLAKDQLVIVIRSNSWSPSVTSYRKAAEIVELTDAMLVLKDQDSNDELRKRVFRRLK
jgi:hypothetical protein